MSDTIFQKCYKCDKPTCVLKDNIYKQIKDYWIIREEIKVHGDHNETPDEFTDFKCICEDCYVPNFLKKLKKFR